MFSRSNAVPMSSRSPLLGLSNPLSCNLMVGDWFVLSVLSHRVKFFKKKISIFNSFQVPGRPRARAEAQDCCSRSHVTSTHQDGSETVTVEGKGGVANPSPEPPWKLG